MLVCISHQFITVLFSCLPVCLFVKSLSSPTHLSPACLPASLSVYLSVCVLSVCPSVRPCVHPMCQTSESHTGDVFYVVEEGNFTIYDDDENELARVGKGSCFGELALLRQVSLRDTNTNNIFGETSVFVM